MTTTKDAAAADKQPTVEASKDNLASSPHKGEREVDVNKAKQSEQSPEDVLGATPAQVQEGDDYKRDQFDDEQYVEVIPQPTSQDEVDPRDLKVRRNTEEDDRKAEEEQDRLEEAKEELRSREQAQKEEENSRILKKGGFVPNKFGKYTEDPDAPKRASDDKIVKKGE